MKPQIRNIGIILFLFTFSVIPVAAQTEQDALMMAEKRLCVAALYLNNNWTNYWEGDFKRDNENIGRLSSNSAMLVFNYGLSKKINLLAALPYVATKAEKGTLSGMRGLQDMGFFVKWKPVSIQKGKQNLSLFAVAGLTSPTRNYNIDFLPMSIGLGTNVFSGRLVADIQRNNLYATITAAYMLRSNVRIDREAYYTNRQIYSSEVKMPDAGSFQFRTGYRSKYLIAEAFLDNMTTFGGFDIRKNDMPFVSNRMNSTRAGIETKYYLQRLPELGIYANLWHTVQGRNVGQSTGYMAGLAYTFNFSSKGSK